ncbi:chaperone required for assembly of F1-ATPase [Breoghania corrubedonensis]|uniref:Chaperone required for assembly of F1-ATPase n=1 Tax=Breoghania corrubedonensis TaxID=665038 RepID=A0A2T5VCP5_9HYPH|nr:ATP12 family protein [Breoghania corrubedonensis]PTW61533.1 chaperone required for assembly of F1-ATPase [Breoghania corrubedonensis]
MSNDLFEPQKLESDVDPIRKAQQMMRPKLPKRFYKDVSVEPRDEGHVILLDGRTVKTPGKMVLALPLAELAEAVAQEWRDQVDVIDPGAMHLTRIVNSGIEAVPARQAEVADAIAAYAGTDLLCYRADGPERLAQRQQAIWGPVLEWAEQDLGARLVLIEGIMPIDQPQEALAAIRGAVGRFGALELAGLYTVTTLTGSVLLALALAAGRIDADQAWAAAYLDEDWNAEQWGQDAEAMRLREKKRVEFDAAVLVLKMLG